MRLLRIDGDLAGMNEPLFSNGSKDCSEEFIRQFAREAYVRRLNPINSAVEWRLFTGSWAILGFIELSTTSEVSNY
jgi:hypothetical protein